MMNTGIIISVIVIIALSVGAFVYLAYKAEKKRTEEFMQVAQELGFDFAPKGDEKFLNRLLPFHLFSHGHSKKLRNLMRGKTSHLEVAIFDYKYETGHGKHRAIWNQTVICFQFVGPELPTFSLRPETIWHKIGSWLGYQDIDFESHPHFSRIYLLRGNNEQEIRKLFTDEILEFFEQTPGICIEGSGNAILFYQQSKRVSPQEIRSFMEEGFKVYSNFKIDEPARGSA